MLQIIGWLLCVYLVVKGFELVAMKHPSAYVGAVLAFLAAPIFFVLINIQSNSSEQPIQDIEASVQGSTTDQASLAADQLEAQAMALENQAAALEAAGQ